ncbi:MAG: 50S ribosomal protein L23 [Candidatus Methanolliviera hydrocarbonicum]|jgi:LSU ribosomal protein L23P|uniref:Large ribosomal subunit protein uL23 n=1 Tax=Candidatus Methanolliviera hydrocarbonicum TaxID=2491085 RepID=A0A520KYC1_9EURY|nr:MAG: 50S ribosomal protein L23 [Candidatus Methanolliviera hydrocarbonicum]
MILKRPVASEKAVLEMEKNNVVCFIVDKNARKDKIKDEFEELYGVKVEKVNTILTFKGEKKAMVRLSDKYKAEDIATKLGIV